MSGQSDDPERGQRQLLTDAMQRAVNEYETDGGIVTGWFAIAQVSRADSSRPYLIYRTGDVNGEGLASWQGLGLLHSAVPAVEEQHFGGARPAFGDPEEDE